MKKYHTWYSGVRIGTFESLAESQTCVIEHPNYKKSLFTKKGKASSNNPDQKAYFAIYDNEGYGWNIR